MFYLAFKHNSSLLEFFNFVDIAGKKLQWYIDIHQTFWLEIYYKPVLLNQIGW